MSCQPSPSRLEAFSDGVIAVIITIMVLEFKVPREDGFAGPWASSIATPHVTTAPPERMLKVIRPR